jgi:hypothetical protein
VEDDVAEVLFYDALGGGGADKPCSDYGDFHGGG